MISTVLVVVDMGFAGVTRRQLPWVEGSLREVLTKRRYVLRIVRENREDRQMVDDEGWRRGSRQTVDDKGWGRGSRLSVNDKD